MKLKLLPKLGGIFLSTDVFLVQSLRQFRRYEVKTKARKKLLKKNFSRKKCCPDNNFLARLSAALFFPSSSMLRKKINFHHFRGNCSPPFLRRSTRNSSWPRPAPVSPDSGRRTSCILFTQPFFKKRIPNISNLQALPVRPRPQLAGSLCRLPHQRHEGELQALIPQVWEKTLCFLFFCYYRYI